MKYSKYALILPALLAAACTDVTGPGATRFHLVTLLGQPLPYTTTRPQLDDNLDPTGDVCEEVLYSQVIELRAPASATLISDRSERCATASPVRATLRQTGTYTQAGDTLSLTIDVGGIIGRHTRTLVSEHNQLVERYRVYTEQDPDGTSGQTYVVAIYEPR